MQAKTFKRRSDIPPFDEVLTNVGQTLYGAVSHIPSYEKQFAVLGLADGGCGILLNADLRDSDVEQGITTELLSAISGANQSLSWRHYADLEILNALAKQSGKEVDEEAHTEIMRDFDRLIGQALALGASDIHITDRKSGTQVEMRISGYLEHIADWPPQKAEQMANSVYRTFGEAKAAEFNLDMMATTNMERDIRHSGKVEKTRLRYTQTPVNPNEFYLNLRILKGMNFSQYTLDEALDMLGYLPKQIELIREIINKPVGALIVAGETGSGKSTLLQAIMESLYKEANGQLNILTAEDPPEYIITGAKQIPVDEKAAGGIKFDEALSLMMRLDGDILCPGEIRGAPSISAVADGALSGHRVLATVHASSAIGIIKRIENIGAKLSVNPMDAETMGGPNFLSGLLHQALLPKVCNECALGLADAITRGVAKTELGDWAERNLPKNLDTIRIRNPEGCSECDGRGLSGRTACGEVVKPDDYLLELIRGRKLLEAEDYFRNSDEMGMTSMDVALHKIGRGIVSPIDAAKFVAGVLDK